MNNQISSAQPNHGDVAAKIDAQQLERIAQKPDIFSKLLHAKNLHPFIPGRKVIRCSASDARGAPPLGRFRYFNQFTRFTVINVTVNLDIGGDQGMFPNALHVFHHTRANIHLDREPVHCMRSTAAGPRLLIFPTVGPSFISCPIISLVI